mmetsp:Transcript_19321/g.54398  ORF Transcript_19321/g.54398 Transcript_19321/m.54398 type:complete len:219 (+) Transcript_19321:476-1132(+)
MRSRPERPRTTTSRANSTWYCDGLSARRPARAGAWSASSEAPQSPRSPSRRRAGRMSRPPTRRPKSGSRRSAGASRSPTDSEDSTCKESLQTGSIVGQGKRSFVGSCSTGALLTTTQPSLHKIVRSTQLPGPKQEAALSSTMPLPAKLPAEASTAWGDASPSQASPSGGHDPNTPGPASRGTSTSKCLASCSSSPPLGPLKASLASWSRAQPGNSRSK